MDELEFERLSLEKERLEREMAPRSEDPTIRRSELEARLEDDQKKRTIRFTPAVTGAIIGAAITLLGNFVAQVAQGASAYLLEKRKLESEIVLEREKFESSLILKALEGKSQKESAENLKFLLDAGLLDSRKDKLSALAEKPERVPSIEPLETRLARMEIQMAALQCEEEGKVFDVTSLKCTPLPLIKK